MAAALDALKAKIKAAAGGALTLSPADVGVDAVSALFTAYVPNGSLTFGNCVASADSLSLTSSLTIGSVTSAAAALVILPDAAGANVSGIVVTLPLGTWQITLPFSVVNASALGS